jgi:hypothetical protein
MPIALTCDCGARFELDDSLAGRDWPCPDCGTSVRAPAKANVPPRFTWLALLAAALGLMGAFTIIGSAAAAIVALVALVVLWRDKEKVAGAQLALYVAIAGGVLTLITLGIWWRPWLVPVAAWLRETSLAGQLDLRGPTEVKGPDGAYSLSRPSKDWVRATRGRVGDPVVGDLQKGRDLVLVHLGDRAYADVSRLTGQGGLPWGELFSQIENDMTPEANDPTDPTGEGRNTRAKTVSPVGPGSLEGRSIEAPEGHVGREYVIELKRGSLRWKFIVRAYKTQRGVASGPVLLVRAYCPEAAFTRLEEEMRKVLDSIQFTD